ncbi:MAG: hypothetical protein ACYC69_00130 [Thermodesulfovibrionales bacterium]
MKTFISYGIMGLVITSILIVSGQLSSAYDGGFAGGGKTIFSKHFQNTLFGVSERAVYSVEILLNDKEYDIGKNVVGMVIHDARDEDVIGAEISFVLKDLVSGESSTLTPTVTDKNNGLYIVSGLDIEKEGKRELAISFKKSRVEDTVKFILPDALKNRMPKGRYSQ